MTAIKNLPGIYFFLSSSIEHESQLDLELEWNQKSLRENLKGVLSLQIFPLCYCSCGNYKRLVWLKSVGIMKRIMRASEENEDSFQIKIHLD